jgi:hypothetical protein
MGKPEYLKIDGSVKMLKGQIAYYLFTCSRTNRDDFDEMLNEYCKCHIAELCDMGAVELKRVKA